MEQSGDFLLLSPGPGVYGWGWSRGWKSYRVTLYTLPSMSDVICLK